MLLCKLGMKQLFLQLSLLSAYRKNSPPHKTVNEQEKHSADYLWHLQYLGKSLVTHGSH